MQTKDQFLDELHDILDSLKMARVMSGKNELFISRMQWKNDIHFTIYLSEGSFIWHPESPAVRIIVKDVHKDVVYKTVLEVSTSKIRTYPMMDFIYDDVLWDYTNANLNSNATFYSLEELHKCLIAVENYLVGSD